MSFHTIPLGEKSPEIINTVIEIPKGSHNKFEYDEKMDLIKLDRVLHSPVVYPLDYGFIPQTRSEDGDHVDVMVIVSTKLFSGCIVSARPIGAIDMEDEEGQDWKIIAVADNDPRMKRVQTIEDMGDHFKKEVQHFFEEYKKHEDKWVNVKGWVGKEDAQKLILEGAEKFKNEK